MERTTLDPRTMHETLTVEDLLNTVADDRHLGWGFACVTGYGLNDEEFGRTMRNVVAVANELGLDYEDLFMWSNSKNGRWLSDQMDRRAPSKRLVRMFLNPDAILRLKKEEGLA